jgi:hypothetical protein
MKGGRCAALAHLSSPRMEFNTYFILCCISAEELAEFLLTYCRDLRWIALDRSELFLDRNEGLPRGPRT